MSCVFQGQKIIFKLCGADSDDDDNDDRQLKGNWKNSIENKWKQHINIKVKTLH